MRIDNPSISGSLSFIGGNNSISATSVNLTGSFSGSVVGTFEGGFSSAATTEISGAFDFVSSSLASRVADQESFSSSLDNTFATDAQVSTAVSSLNAATSSYLQNTTDTLTGDLTVTGTLTAQDLHVQEVTSSIVFSSGSNKFGETLSNTHEFTGSLQVSGSVLLDNNQFYEVERTDGANFKIAGLTDGNVIQVGAIDYTSGATVFAGGYDITFKTAGADGTSRMRIDPNGNVGINTTSPDGIFKAVSGSAPNASQILIGYNSTSENYFDANTQIFRNGSYAEKMRIDSNGNLQIATSALSGSGDPRVTVGSKGNYYHGSGTGLGDFHVGNGNYGLSIGAALGGGGAGDIRVWTTGGTHKLYIGTNSADHVSIDSVGNVGIGTTEGRALLHLRSATPYIYLDDTSTTGTRTRFQLTVGDVGSTQTGTFSFNNTAGTSLLDVMTINENGNVGVGTTAAATKFHSYTSATAPAIIAQGDSGNEQIVIKRYSNANEQLILGFHSSDYGRIQAIEQGVAYRPLALNQDGGSVGIGTISPVSRFEVRESLNSTNFTGITVTNSEGGSTNLSRAGIAFKAYDWVQSAIWHGRNMTDGNQGALVLGTNPNTTDLTVGGVVGRMWIVNDGNVGVGTADPTAKLDVVSTSPKIVEFERQGSANYDLTVSDAGAGAAQLWFNANTNNTGFLFRPKSSGGTQTNAMLIDSNGNVGVNATNPNATLHVNGGVHFGPDSGVLNPSTGQVLIETVGGGTPKLQMYPYGASVFEMSSDGTTAVIGWGSGADREVNILNTGAGKISVGIGTGAPSSTLHVFGNLSSNPLTFEGNSSSNAWVRFKAGSTASTWQIGATSGAFQFYDELNTATRAVINSDGNLGIGTTSPANLLHLKGDNRAIIIGDNNTTVGDTIGEIQFYASNNSSYSAGIKSQIDSSEPGIDRVSLSFHTTTYTTSLQTGAERMRINANGNVGIGTTSPTAKLDVNGSVRYRGEIYQQDSFIASGNYSSGTWYDATDTGQLTENGIYIISAYVDDYAAGGSTYFCWYASVPFNWVTTGTNRTTAVTFPTLLGTGHAAGTIPSFRITQELGTAGAKSRIQFNPNNNWSGIDNGNGKSFRVYFKRIGG